MKITNQVTGNPGANPEFAKEEYKVRAMPGKLRPVRAPERTRSILIVVLAILVVGGIIGGEVYLILTKPDIAPIKSQMKKQAQALSALSESSEDQKTRLDEAELKLAGLPSKEDFDSMKTSLTSLEQGQEDLKARIGLADIDQDGIPDVWEEKYGLNPEDRRDAKLDTDKDKLINLYEYLLDCDPTNKDTDGDGYLDGKEVEKGYNPKGKGKLDEILKVELIELTPKEEGAEGEVTDTDEDGMSDDWEDQYGLNPNDPTDAKGDIDGDGLTNLNEYTYGTDPTNKDTDGDGFLDGEEVSAGYNPAGSGKLGEIEELGEKVEEIEEKAKEAGNGILGMPGGGE